MDHITKLLQEMTPLEWAAAITTLAYVYLTVKNRIDNWYWGIAAVLFYAAFFWKISYYANAALNLFYYLPCCIYGWWVWKKQGPTQNDDLPVTSLTGRALIGWLIVSVVFSVCIGYPIAHSTPDPHPYADAFTTGFSIVAQYLQAKKIFENWWMWIGVDLIYTVYLFPSQGVVLSTIVYVIVTLLAIRGAIEWKPLIGKPKIVPVKAVVV